MIGPEVMFDYMQLLWFQPLTGDYVDLRWDGVDLGQPLPVSACGRALFIPTNMYGGPIRFRLLIDVDESWAAAELGPHDRREAGLVLHSEGPPTASWRWKGVCHRGRAARRGRLSRCIAESWDRRDAAGSALRRVG